MHSFCNKVYERVDERETGHNDDVDNEEEGFSIYFRVFSANPTCVGAT